jgi:hypothetical protein
MTETGETINEITTEQPTVAEPEGRLLFRTRRFSSAEEDRDGVRV